MIERNSGPLQLATGNLGQTQGYSPSSARMGEVDNTASLGEQALAGLLDFGVKTATEQFQTQVGEAYMQGQRARMLGQSVEDVDANPLAAPFVRGGFQDQDYRIKQAEFSSEMATFIAEKGKTMAPEAFLQELATKARPVLDSSLNNGMSAYGKYKALESQTALEGTLITAHGKAYQEYAIEQAGQRFTIGGNSLMLSYQTAKNTGVGEPEALGALLGYYQELKSTDQLPAEMRGEVAKNFLLAAVEADNREVVELLEHNDQLLDMPFEDRKQLTEAMRESENRTQLMDKQADYRSWGAVMVQLDEGTPLSSTQFQAAADQAIAAGILTPKGYQSAIEKYLKSSANAEDLQTTFDALLRGDTNAVYATGKDYPAAFKAAQKYMQGRGVPPAEQHLTLMQMAYKNGSWPEESKAALNTAFSQYMLNPESVSPLNNDLLTTYLGQSTLMSGDPKGQAVWLDAVGPEYKAVATHAAFLVSSSGIDAKTALSTAANRQAEWGTKTDDEKKRITTEIKAGISSAVETSTFAQTIRVLTPGVGSTLRDTGSSASDVRMAVAAEAMRIADQPGWAGVNSEEVVAQAVSAVQSRTLEIPVEGSQNVRLLLPGGKTLETLTGSLSTTNAAKAIAEVYKPSGAGLGIDFKAMPGSGEVMVVEYNKETGVPVGPLRPVNWDKVKERVVYIRDEMWKETAPFHMGAEVAPNGALVPTAVPGQTTTRADGINTAGIPRRQAMAFRRNLIRHEGVRNEVYLDTRGNPTIGAGIHVPGAKVGDTLPKAQLDQLFARRSDEALVSATRIVRQLGIPDPDNIATTALAGVAYQMGEGELKDFPKMLAALQAGDWRQFEQEARDSEWNKQTPKRVDDFLQQMQGYFGTQNM